MQPDGRREPVSDATCIGCMKESIAVGFSPDRSSENSLKVQFDSWLIVWIGVRF
jgi:hypothetical protein